MTNSAIKPKVNNETSNLLAYDNYIKKVVKSLIRLMKLHTSIEEDLISAGYVGLMEASLKFKRTEDENEFKSFAYLRVRGSIIDAIRKNSHLSRAGYKVSKLIELSEEIRKSQKRPEFSIKKEELKELDQFINKSNEQERKIAHTIDYLSNFIHLFKKVYDDEKGIIKRNEVEMTTPEERLIQSEKKELVNMIIKELPEYERHIIYEHYYKDRQFNEIAKDKSGHGKCEKTKSWVSKSHTRALRRLRKICIAEELR